MIKVLVDGQTLSTPEMGRGIGLTFARLFEEMAAGAVGIEWHLAVRDERALETLPPGVRQACEPVVVPLVAQGGQREWCEAYGATLQQVVDRLRPDWYWNPNPLMPNVHFPYGLQGVRTLWTLHDLIPLLFPAWYLDGWPEGLREDYHGRLQALAARSDVLACVSEATAADFRRHFPQARCELRAVPWGSDYSAMYPLRHRVRREPRPYVLYVGGFDPRKNMARAVEAFARFLATLPEPGEPRPRLVLVSPREGDEARALMERARELGIGGDVELTGTVDDAALARLHRGASIFFFPSLYEGFGLPVLDALACGIPVVAADSPAVREVCGRYAFFADGEQAEDLASQLGAAWSATRQRPLPWSENARHARERFDWPRAADAYLGILHSPSRAPAAGAGRTRVAMFCPWPPQRTGVADYCFELASHLAARAELTVFTGAESPQALPDVDVRPLSDFAADPGRHPNRIYHLGNGGLHRDIFELAWQHPGVVEIHDYNINPFFVHFYLRQGQPERYRDLLLTYGAAGEQAWARYEADGTVPSTWDFPMIEPVLARSRGAVAHSRWVARRVRAHVPVTANHLGVKVPPRDSLPGRDAACEALGLDPSHIHVGVFGFVNSHKRVDVAAQAIGQLRAAGYPVRLLVVGDVIDDRVSLDDMRRFAGLGEEGLVSTGFVTDDTFSRYLAATDVMVNLRYPTMGESSASLFHAMRRCVPTLVTDTGPFSELPDWATWKVPLDALRPHREVDVLRAYLGHLFREPDARLALAEGGAAFVARFADFDRAADACLAHFGEDDR